MRLVLESVGIVKDRIIEGIALVPTVSKNGNIYSEEEILKSQGLDISLPADWEHTDEIIGDVVFSLDESIPAIKYRADVKTERAKEITEGVHKVSIEADVKESVTTCTKQRCYNLVSGITFEGIGITKTPGVTQTTLRIVESLQEWNVIKHKCESCVGDCLQKKADAGKDPTDPQNQAICFSECDEKTLEKKVNELESIIRRMNTCTICGKQKKFS